MNQINEPKGIGVSFRSVSHQEREELDVAGVSDVFLYLFVCLSVCLSIYPATYGISLYQNAHHTVQHAMYTLFLSFIDGSRSSFPVGMACQAS